MKLFKILSIFLLLQNIILAQDPVPNFGAMQVHNGTSVGFHLDLVNNGVFSKNNYTNEFGGYSNRSSVITKNYGLASGIYFYIITLNDLRQKHQGYLYLTSNAKK